MALTDKIKQYAGDLTGLDSTYALRQAVDHTLAMAKQVSPIQYQAFVNKIPIKATIANGLELASNKIFDVVKVTRGDYTAQPIAPESEKRASDSDSIYYAQAYSPVYVVDFEGSLKIYPDCANTSAATRGAVYVVFNSDHKTVDDSAETIKDTAHNLFGENVGATEKFPTHWKQYLILHAAEILLGEKLADMGAKLPTDLDADTTLFDQIGDLDLSIIYTFPSADYQDALDKAQFLVDKTASIGDDGTVTSAQSWLEDEDEDMVSSTLQVAAQELSRANAILSEFNAEINAKVTDKSQELQEFQTNLQKKMTLYDKIISKLSIDYQWVQGQLPIVQSKKQEFLQSVGKGGLHDSPDEGQI